MTADNYTPTLPVVQAQREQSSSGKPPLTSGFRTATNVEQLTYLLFLTMDYERTRPPFKQEVDHPRRLQPASLIEVNGLPRSSIGVTWLSLRGLPAR